jgi:hypothetical protein
MCSSGFNQDILDGTGFAIVGENCVGGSILCSISTLFSVDLAIQGNTDLTLMMKTLKPLTGMCTPLKTCANRKRPRPLLVVHSGRITIAPREDERMSSTLLAIFKSLFVPYGGTRPVIFSISNNDTVRNPKMLARSDPFFAGY